MIRSTLYAIMPNDTRRQREMQELVVQQHSYAMEQTDLQISDTKTQYSAQMNSQLSQISSQLDEIEAGLEKYRLSKEHQNITAPVSGYINSISVNTLCETVTSAQDMVTIVPDNTPVEMVCYVKNMDIADVEIGMETEIKLEAYSYNKYGTVKGTVKYISPSAFSSEQMGSVYLVKIEVTDIPDGISVISGLSGSVEIKTDQRTVIEYFIEPIIKGFGESWPCEKISVKSSTVIKTLDRSGPQTATPFFTVYNGYCNLSRCYSVPAQ